MNSARNTPAPSKKRPFWAIAPLLLTLLALSLAPGSALAAKPSAKTAKDKAPAKSAPAPADPTGGVAAPDCRDQKRMPTARLSELGSSLVSRVWPVDSLAVVLNGV